MSWEAPINQTVFWFFYGENDDEAVWRCRSSSSGSRGARGVQLGGDYIGIIGNPNR